MARNHSDHPRLTSALTVLFKEVLNSSFLLFIHSQANPSSISWSYALVAESSLCGRGRGRGRGGEGRVVGGEEEEGGVHQLLLVPH